MKKTISILIAVSMILTMGTSVFADVSLPATNTNLDSIVIERTELAGPRITTFGTTSKRELSYESSGTKYNDAKTKKVVYTIKTYKVYKKAEHSKTWRYNYTEHHWTFKGYNKVNGTWVYKTTESGVDRVHGDPQSLLNYYLKLGY